MQVANRFDATKNYVGMGFHPRVLQDSEMNELVSIIQHQQKMINLLLYPEGTLIKGGVVATEDGFRGSQATILVDGYYLHVPEKSVPTEKSALIGIKYRAKTLTAKMDESLRDANKESINYGMPGADRLAYDVEWSHEGDVLGPEWKFTATHELVEGVLKASKPVHNLRFLSNLSYDAIVGPGGYTSIPEALNSLGENSKVLVTGDGSYSKPILIKKNYTEIHFASGVHCRFNDDFNGDALFNVAENIHANIKGGIFPSIGKNKKLCIAKTKTVFVSEVYLSESEINLPDAVENCEIFGIRG
ncbi:MAG: DUF4815 domain-containing protein [Oligoflexales bacterium]